MSLKLCFIGFELLWVWFRFVQSRYLHGCVYVQWLDRSNCVNEKIAWIWVFTFSKATNPKQYFQQNRWQLRAWKWKWKQQRRKSSNCSFSFLHSSSDYLYDFNFMMNITTYFIGMLYDFYLQWQNKLNFTKLIFIDISWSIIRIGAHLTYVINNVGIENDDPQIYLSTIKSNYIGH